MSPWAVTTIAGSHTCSGRVVGVCSVCAVLRLGWALWQREPRWASSAGRQRRSAWRARLLLCVEAVAQVVRPKAFREVVWRRWRQRAHEASFHQLRLARAIGLHFHPLAVMRYDTCCVERVVPTDFVLDLYRTARQ